MPSMPERRPPKSYGLIDIGTSKIAAAVLVTSPGAATPAHIAGFGVYRSRGVKAGVLIDLDEAEQALRSALVQAERGAGSTIERVTVSVSCGRLASEHFSASADIEQRVVRSGDTERLMAGARFHAERDGRSLLHINRLGYRVDGAPGVRDPIGLAARQIAADLHAVTVDEGPLRNLQHLIERCHLSCDGFVAAPYASALAVTSVEERQLGITCIDIGAGTATISMFADGHFLGADAIAAGSQLITTDIARALQMPLIEAERIKTLYGTLVTAQSDEHDVFTYPLAGDDDGAMVQSTKARLTEIIRPRVAHILALVQERLGQLDAARYAGENIVLTGGASLLTGAAEFSADALGRPVRLGKPQPLAGSPGPMDAPHLSVLRGLAAAVSLGEQDFVRNGERDASSGGYLARVGSWLKSGF